MVFEGSYYSAPYRLVGQTLWIRGGTRTVELFTDDHHSVAIHDRASQPGERKTILAHLPPHKVDGLVSGREACRTQALSIGPATAQVVQQLLEHRPEDRLHVAQRVLRLAERSACLCAGPALRQPGLPDAQTHPDHRAGARSTADH